MSNVEMKFNKRDIRSLSESFSNSSSNIQNRFNNSTNRINREKKRVIEGKPWDIGAGGGGAPRDTGRLMRDHIYGSQGSKSTVEVKNPYAMYVHGGTEHMEARPWLNYTVNEIDRFLDRETGDLLDNITEDLSN